MSSNTSYRGGCTGWCDTEGSVGTWSKYFWLDTSNTTHACGNPSDSNGKLTSTQMKALVSNGTFSSTDWATDASINNGYPHLIVFDDTSIWLRNSSINDGEPYLKNNLPVE